MNVVITGASQGIGSEIVRILSRSKKNHVVAISRNEKRLRALVEECKKNQPEANITPYAFDLTQFDFYSLVIQRIQTYMPHCDILINNAGALVNKPFLKMDQADFDDLFDVNIKGLFFFTQAMVPLMNKGSHIVNISSLGGVQGSRKFRGLSAYSASKGAVTIFTEALAVELSDDDIRVNCLALGGVDTEMFRHAFPHAEASFNPAQMAQYIVDFALTGGKYFNGKVLPVSVATP